MKSFNFIEAIILLIAVIVIDCREMVFDPNPISNINFKETKGSNVYLSAIREDNQYAFVSAREGGVFVVSLEVVIHPRIVAVIQTPQAQYLYVQNNILFIGDIWDGLLIYNITDIEKPQLISKWQDYKHIQSVVVTKDQQIAYALGNGIVFSIDISVLSSPKTICMNGVISPDSYRVKLSTDETHLVVANHIKGVQIIDVRYRQQIILRADKIPAYVIWDSVLTPDQTAIYAVDAYYGLFYAYVKPIFDMPIGSTEIYDLKFISIFKSTQAFLSVAITGDGLFLIVGLRSVGLKLFQIVDKNYEEPIFVQNMEGEYLSNDVIFSHGNNEQYVYVTNGMSLLIYQQVQLYTNKNFPNIFNLFQSSKLVTSSEFWPWQVICLSDNNHVIQTATSEGSFIFDIQNRYYPEQIGTIPQERGHFGGLQISQDLKALYIASSESGLSVYDTQNLKDPQFKSNFTPLDPTKYMNQGVAISFDKSGKIIILANGFQGFGIYDATNPFELKELGVYLNSQFACGFEQCVITSDLTTIICACREIGLLFYDFTNQNLQLVYILQKLGSEYMIFSKDEKYAFVCNGFQGIVIVNIQNKLSPFIVGEQPLDGWAQSLVTLFDEKYILASQIEKGQLVIVNIEDFKNPYIQSKLQFPNESGNSVCITPDNKSAYFIGNMGLRYLPIQTSLTIHTQIQVEMTDSEGLNYYKNLSNNESLLVGQIAHIFFIPLYTQVKMRFFSALYYRNFEKNVLPFWITFYENKNYLSMIVDKSGALNTFSNEKQGENIIILECLTTLTSDNFISDIIDDKLAPQIYKSLVIQGYIDSQGFLTQKLDSTIEFYLDFFDDTDFTKDKVGDSKKIKQIQNIIKEVLVFSKTEYPIRFFVKSSLTFNYDRIKNPNLNIVESPSLQISVLIQIVRQGIFVKKSFDGVLISFSDDQTSLKISGQTSYVNNILNSQIQIANKTTDLSECLVDFIISDSSNFDVSKRMSLSELSFITLHQPVELNQENNLQIQFNRYYSGGNLYVEERFQFSFDLNTFKQKDNLSITYKAYIEDGLELTEITTGDWLEFNQFNLGFSGIKTISSFLSSYTVRIVASDGYSSTYDSFTMDFKKIPFLYVIQLIIQIVGPILGIFGVWRYRADIYIFLMERFYLFGNESAVVESVFKKQIVLMNDIWEDAQTLWSIYKSRNKNFDAQITQQYKISQKIETREIMESIFEIYFNNPKKYPNIDPREFEFSDSRLVRIYKRFCYDIVLKQDKNTKVALQALKHIGIKAHTRKDWYKYFVNIKPKFEVSKNKVVQQVNSQKQSPPQNNNTQKDTVNVNHLDVHSIDSKREVQGQEMISQDENPNSMKINPSIIMDDNFTNRENQAKSNLFFFGSDHNNYGLKSPQKKTQNTDQQTPFTSTRAALYKNEYKKEPKKEGYEEMNNFNPFPEVIVKIELIVSSLSATKPYLKWDKKLLTEILILESLGIRSQSPSRVSPALGESLHLLSHQLLRVQAFKKDSEDSCCISLKKFFNANYSPIGLNQNNPLPQWLNCQIIDGVIHMWGTPKSNDDPEVLIRVIDQLTFTDKEGNDLRDKSIKSMNKLKSENNLIAQAKNQKQQQQQQQNEDIQHDNQIKTLSNIPKLSKFSSAAISQDYQRRRVMTQQSIPTNLIAFQQQQYQLKELPEIQEMQYPVKNLQQSEDDSEINKKNKRIQDVVEKIRDINQTSINLDMSSLQENYKNEKEDNDEQTENQVGQEQELNVDLEEKQYNEEFPKVTITNYIKTQK